MLTYHHDSNFLVSFISFNGQVKLRCPNYKLIYKGQHNKILTPIQKGTPCKPGYKTLYIAIIHIISILGF